MDDIDIKDFFSSLYSKENENEEPTEKKLKTDQQQDIRDNLHGIVFALCCYHRCTWDTYLGLDFMRANDITPIQFHWMTKMATWSTCGFVRRVDGKILLILQLH